MALSWEAPKDPDEVKDYVINWATLLGTDTIATSTWTAPTGITKNSSTNTATTSTVWLSGGTAGSSYLLLNRITTVGLRTYDRTIKLKIKSL